MNHRELWNMGGYPFLVKITFGLLFWYPILILFYLAAGTGALIMLGMNALIEKYFPGDE